MGRKRKANVARHPSGQIKYDPPRPHNQRLLDYARLRDPLLGTPLGLMLYDKRIDQPQYEAGMAYREARDAADRALGLPGRHPRGQDLSAVHGLGMGLSDDLAQQRREKCEKRLYDMEAAIGDHVALAAVQAVVVYEQVPAGHAQFLQLVGALTRLAAWRKVTGGRRA